MGFAKKALQFASKTQPHSWFLDKKTNASIDLGGQITGAYDDIYKVKDPEAIPTASTDGAASSQADFARRLAKKANGRDSTIRTSPAGALYGGSPAKSLLGS